jgi:hypothetical protein
MARETTASFIARLAARHHVTLPDMLRFLGMPLSSRRIAPHDTPKDYDTNELYLNAEGRRLIVHACGIPEDHLLRALPQWRAGDAYQSNPETAGDPRAWFRASHKPSVLACPRCAARRTGSPWPVRQYLYGHQLLCARHHVWMLHRHTLGGEEIPFTHVDLSVTPELVAAHRAHLRLLYRGDNLTATIFQYAARLTDAWRQLDFRQEKVWARRARRFCRGKRPQLWSVLAREALTYPETVAIAEIMNRPGWVFHPAALRAAIA